jgi:Outer membrane protein beta-barrel domain
MKKLIITLNLILVIALFSQPCASQIDLVLGLSKSSITGSSSWQDPIGFQVGAIVPVVNINDMLCVRAEANLSLQGAKWKEGSLSGRTNLLYINVPLVVRYQTESGFFGEAGLQPGLLLSAKDKYEGITESYMDHMNAIDLSIPVGVGYEFDNNFGVGFRVITGISDITKDKDYADRNLVFVLRGTYKLGKK